MFEPELWGVSPLIPDGKTPTYKSAGTPAGGDATAAKSKDGLKLWDGGSFDFHDILDIINPLHHLPIVNSIYRSEVKDEIGAVPRILGSMLYGGGVVGALIGAASAIVNIVVEHETGKDLGQHIYTAIFGEGAGTRRTTQLAAPKTGEAAAAAAKKAAEAKPAAAAVTGPQAAATPAATTAGTETGKRALSSKADAALQAFVAGLAKNASPAAAAAANAAITKRSLRVSGAASAAAAATAKNGTGAVTKGEVSTQFRRADWYQRNQAVLKAQAAELAKRSAAATNASKPGTTNAKSGAAILQLFMKPSLASGMPTETRPGKAATGVPATATPAAGTAAAKPAATKSASASRGAVAGPWVANEIANGLSKYEALVNARKATAGR